MPWTPEKPYTAQLFAHENDDPEEMFYETPEQLEKEIEKHRRTGLYARIRSEHRKSADRNEWEEISEWERGNGAHSIAARLKSPVSRHPRQISRGRYSPASGIPRSP
jgi:hypothetical protein